MGALGNAYLVLYNVVQFVGWSHMLYILIPHFDTALVKGVDKGELYTDIKLSIMIFQTAAVLEVVHAAVGLVKTNPMLALFQVFSRVFVAWAILEAVPEARVCRGLPLLLTAWIITEMIRYSFYTVNLLGTNIYIITWLRYKQCNGCKKQL
jgi:very-long-chain (3R)-3-hydroxyacyl-CoA dehydratase